MRRGLSGRWVCGSGSFASGTIARSSFAIPTARSTRASSSRESFLPANGFDGGRLPLASCPELVERNGAMIPSCDPASGYPLECDRVLDAPTFTELPGTDALCDAAGPDGDFVLRVPGPIAIDDLDCEGMSLRGEAHGFRIHFGDVASAALHVANLPVDHLVAGARVRDGACSRWLMIHGSPTARRARWSEILDLPPEGGELWLEDADGAREPRWLRVSAVTDVRASCAPLGRACIEGSPLGVGPAPEFALEPCGGTWMPLGGCGDPVFAGFVGSDSCGGRIHAMFSATDYVPICH